jgi:hypothetical protein
MKTAYLLQNELVVTAEGVVVVVVVRKGGFAL